jgi:hypothetical protein
MRKLSDLISDIQYELKQVPVQNAAALTVLGFEVQLKVQSMIGTHQLFWKDLARSTVETKQRKKWGKGGDASSPLYAKGDFERSIEYRLVGRNRVQIFSEAESAQYTERGTSKMPPRPVFKPAAKIVLRSWVNKGTLANFYLKSLR